MSVATPGDITTVLQTLHPDDVEGRSQFLSLVYDELRRMAGAFMREERPSHSWQATDLAHEAVARLLGQAANARDRRQFFAAVARIMRELLIDHARHRQAAKHGGGRRRLSLDDVADHIESHNIDVCDLREALERLAELNERQSEVVTLHFLWQHSLPETAQLLGVSLSTVESDWRSARAWLYNQLAETNG